MELKKNRGIKLILFPSGWLVKMFCWAKFYFGNNSNASINSKCLVFAVSNTRL
jgi:hypothetical protein